ncbi:MAG TPA: IS4 family transposase [Microbacteriaceae bacterium]|nr:IS4 family transposase [Microbacteriaceae bacterium]
MDVDTLRSIFRATLDPEYLLASARSTGAFVRIREIQPVPFLMSLLAGCAFGAHRDIALSRRLYEQTEGPVASSTFDDRVDSPGTARWLWSLLCTARTRGNRAAKRAWPKELAALTDILLEDGTVCALRGKSSFESTRAGKGAVKLLSTVSLSDGQMVAVRLAAAVHHDRPLLRGAPVPGALYLRDLGFYDHGEFVRIAKEAFLVSRLKLSAVPRLVAITRGLPDHCVGERMTDALPYEAIVDADATVTVEGEAHTFRVVCVPVPAKNAKGQRIPGQTMAGWYITNLPREQFDAECIALLYRLRWAIERVFRRAKQRCALSALRTRRPTVMATFVAASLLVLALGTHVTAALRDGPSPVAISEDTVLHVLQARWPSMLDWWQQSDPFSTARWVTLRNVLVYETQHRNKKRPLSLNQICGQIADRTDRHTQPLAA